MSTRNAYCIAVPTCDDAEEVSAFEDGHTACLGSHEFGVVSHDSGSMHDEVCAFDIFGSLTDENGYAHISYGVEGLGLVVIRACEVVALTVEYLREGVHTRAADTDEVNMFFAF